MGRKAITSKGKRIKTTIAYLGRYARKMKSILVLLLLTWTQNLSAADRAVPEDVLNSWGYKSTSFEDGHRIRAIEP